MKKINLKNYTTSVPEERSIMEIEQLLAKFGASAILKDYSGDGTVKAISFKISTEHGEMPFKLPMKEREIVQYRVDEVEGEKAKENRKKDYKTARQIGWRIIKDWLHSQLSLVQLNMVKVQEVLLPYVYNYSTSKTFYETIEENKFKGMLLEEIKKGE